jgi:hypothetical protein
LHAVLEPATHGADRKQFGLRVVLQVKVAIVEIDDRIDAADDRNAAGLSDTCLLVRMGIGFEGPGRLNQGAQHEQ